MIRAFLTCHHVLNNLKLPAIVIASPSHGSWTVIPILFARGIEEANTDIAIFWCLLPLELAGLQGISIHPDAVSLPEGSPVHLWGFPQTQWGGNTSLLSSGIISHRATPVYPPYEGKQIVFNADAHHGNSGGPLLLDETARRCLGVVTNKFKDSFVTDKFGEFNATLASLTGGAFISGIDPLAAMLVLAKMIMVHSHLGIGTATPLTKSLIKRLVKNGTILYQAETSRNA